MEDSSNFDLTYARNRLRQEVVPVLQELNPAFISTLTANLDHLREDRDLLEGMAQRAIQEARVTEGRVSIPASTLAALDHPIAVRAVKLLCWPRWSITRSPRSIWTRFWPWRPPPPLRPPTTCRGTSSCGGSMTGW